MVLESAHSVEVNTQTAPPTMSSSNLKLSYSTTMSNSALPVTSVTSTTINTTAIAESNNKTEQDSCVDIVVEDLVDENDIGKQKPKWYSMRWEEFDAERFVTGYYVKPLTLLAVRLFFVTYMSAVIFTQAFKYHFGNGNSFKYFTWLCYFSLYFYFIAASVHTAAHVLKGRPVLLLRQHRYLNRLFWVVYELEMTFHVLVPAIYWLLLSADAPNPHTDPVGFWINCSVHGFEFIFMVVEVALNRNLFMPSHVVFMFIAAWAYCGYAWVWHAFGAALPYGFLSIWWYYLLLPVIFGMVYIAQYFIHNRKQCFLGPRYKRKMASQQQQIELATAFTTSKV